MQNNDMGMLYKDGYLLSGGSYIIKGEREGKTHFEKGIKATDITDKKALQFFAKLFNLPTIELNGKIFKLNRQSLKKFIQRHPPQSDASTKSRTKLNTEECVAEIKKQIHLISNPDTSISLQKKLAGQASVFTLSSKIKAPSEFDIKESTLVSALEALGLQQDTITEIKKNIATPSSSGLLILQKDKILNFLTKVADKLNTKDETLTPFIDLLKKRVTAEQADIAIDGARRKAAQKTKNLAKKMEAPPASVSRKLSDLEKSEIKALLSPSPEDVTSDQKFSPDKIIAKDISHHYNKTSSKRLSGADKDLIAHLIVQGKFAINLLKELSFANQLAVALKLAERADFLFNPAANTVIKEFIKNLSGEESRLLLCLITSEDYATDEAVQRLNLLQDEKIAKIEDTIALLTSIHKEMSSKNVSKKKSVAQKNQAAHFSMLLLQLEQFNLLSSKKSEIQKALCKTVSEHFQKSLDALTSDPHFMELSKDKNGQLEKLTSKKKIEDFFEKDTKYATETVIRISATVLTNAIHSKVTTAEEKASKIRQIGNLLDAMPPEHREAVVEKLRSTHKNVYRSFINEWSKQTNRLELDALIKEVANGSDLQRISSPILVNHIMVTLTEKAINTISLQKFQESSDPAHALTEARNKLIQLIPNNQKLIALYLEPSVTELKKIHEADAPAETLLSVTHKLLLKNVSNYGATSLLDKQLLAYCFDKLSQLKLDGNSALQFEKLFTAQRDLMSPGVKKAKSSSPLSPTGPMAKPKVADVTKSLGIFSTTRIGLTKMIAQLKAFELLDTPAETKKAFTETREALEAVLKDLSTKGTVAHNFKEKIETALLVKKHDADTVKSISIDEIDAYRKSLMSGEIPLPDKSLDLNQTLLRLDTLINKKFVFSPESERDNLIRSYSAVLAGANFKKSISLLDKLFSLLEKQTKAIDLSDKQVAALKQTFIPPPSKQVGKKLVFSLQPSEFINEVIGKYQTALEPSFKELCEDLSQEYGRISEDPSISPDKKLIYSVAQESAKSAFQAILNRSLLANYKKTLSSSK